MIATHDETAGGLPTGSSPSLTAGSVRNAAAATRCRALSSTSVGGCVFRCTPANTPEFAGERHSPKSMAHFWSHRRAEVVGNVESTARAVGRRATGERRQSATSVPVARTLRDVTKSFDDVVVVKRFSMTAERGRSRRSWDDRAPERRHCYRFCPATCRRPPERLKAPAEWYDVAISLRCRRFPTG